jgi:two-component system chemotaxis sensor kinase CheA
MTAETHLSLEEVTALKETFRAQALELLEDYGRFVLELERAADPADVLKSLRRVVHTLKGDSMSLEFDRLAELAHRLEDLLASIRDSDQSTSRVRIDLLLACGDAMSTLLDGYCSEPPKPPISIASLLERLDVVMNEPEKTSSSAPAAPLYELTITFNRKCQMHSAGAFIIQRRIEPLGRIHEASPDPEATAIEKSRTWTLIIESDRKPEILRGAARVAGVSSRVKIEPFKGPPPAAVARLDESPSDEAAQPSTKPSSSLSDQLRMDVGKIDRVMNLVGELVIGRSMVSQALSELAATDESAVSRLSAANDFLERTLTELQAVVLKIRMVPVDHVFRRFPRVVRDLAHSSGKEVELEIRGASTELDKSIVDALHEPLLHLVRNAIDHGIESPDARKRAGKSRIAKLTLAAFYEGNHVHILIEDDGGGIDVDEVRRRAVELGVVDRQEIDSLPQEEILNVIFHPGFSTKTSVSTVSGRGIGMDVVRSALESLKGTIDVNTKVGQGTQFVLRLPLTLAILKAILVESAGRIFAIPLSGVLEIVRLFAEEEVSVLGKGVMHLRDRVVPLVDLRETLELESERVREKTDRAFVILVGEAERRLGLVVDKLHGEHELVVKPIEDPLVRSPGVAGASILGDGKVVLILNLRGIAEKKRRMGRRAEGLK